MPEYNSLKAMEMSSRWSEGVATDPLEPKRRVISAGKQFCAPEETWRQVNC